MIDAILATIGTGLILVGALLFIGGIIAKIPWLVIAGLAVGSLGGILVEGRGTP